MSGLIKSKNSSLKMIISYFLVIFILIGYGSYKNGWLLYQKDLISFLGVFKPISMLLIAIIIVYIVDFVFYKVIFKQKDYWSLLLNDFKPIFMALLVLTLPSQINLFLLIILILIFSIIINLIKDSFINVYSLAKIIIILILVIFNVYNYSNTYELNVDTALTTFDLFMGRSIGGIGTTNSLLLIISYIVLSFNAAYKKDIPVIALAVYFMMMIFSSCFSQNIIFNIKELLNSEFLFVTIFIATIPNYSPIVKNERILYAILIGILSFIFAKLINPFEG